jgi:hypothetical protein
MSLTSDQLLQEDDNSERSKIIKEKIKKELMTANKGIK